MSQAQLRLVLTSMLAALDGKSDDYHQGYRHALQSIEKLLAQPSSD